ncbi:MAG: hypothetical protein GY859_33855, partial [Desulfobacterales bacterium]|nr:hypothetical protein [Desulfobacterales bacterium]
ERSITLDGVRRIRVRRNYRERPIYVMNNREVYLDVIGQCELLVQEGKEPRPEIEDIIGIIERYEAGMEEFALRHQRFAILGLSIQAPEELRQIANHYLDDTPELQKRLSKALYGNHYKVDIFLAEADTLIAQYKHRINLCSHDAYGINTVRNPVWSVYWKNEKHDRTVKEFKKLGFKTGDSVGIDVDAEGKPTVIRL